MFGPYPPDSITTGDSRLLAEALPDGCCDMIFCDPVYQQVEDYRWLAEVALRLLKPRGALLAFGSKPKIGRCQAEMEAAGMQYVYTLDHVVVAKTGRMRWYNLFCWSTPCLWMQRPGSASRPKRWIPDTFISHAAPTGRHKWNKNEDVIASWLTAFTEPGAVVFDPFCGGGTVPAMCRRHSRTFIAFEIDPATADAARSRVAATQVAAYTDAVVERPDLWAHGDVNTPTERNEACDPPETLSVSLSDSPDS